MSTTFSGEYHIRNLFPGERIIFKNFLGAPTAYNREGDRSFCLIITDPTLRNILIKKGCNIKKLNSLRSVNYDLSGVDPVEFIRIKLPKYNFGISGDGDEKTLFSKLDHCTIVSADIRAEFFDMDIDVSTGVKHITTIYLNRGTFYLGDGSVIEIGKGIKNTNTEETKMEKIMSVEEILAQFALLELAYRHAKPADQKNLEDIMKAVRSAEHYIIPKVEDRCEIAENPDTKIKSTREAIGDFAAIKQVIFNDPATVVVWWDDVRTVVKCQEGDIYDKEKGLAMCICKRLFGNQSNYNNVINKWAHPKKPKETVEKDKTSAKKDDKLPKDLPMVRKLRADELLITDSWRECVRKRLAQNGWSQKDLFRRSGVSAQTISRIVGKYGPSPLKVVVFDKINKTLNIRWKVEEDATPSSKKKEKSSNLVPLTDELINSVREKMKKRNISLSDLSRMSGVSLSAIGRYFSGNSPRPKAMHKRKYDAIMKVIDSSES